MARVEFKNVNRTFGNTGAVVDGFNLSIKEGDFVALLGPSGCGKSTLLRMIAGLDQPDAGVVDVVSSREKFFRAFVFQEAQLLPWRNVIRNVMLPLELMRRSSGESEEIARETLAKVGLGDALEKYPNQLSGGMKMRVSLARALVTEPTLLLLDEPFAALDENTRFHLQDDLISLWQKRRMTVVFVTHSVMEAAYLSTRAVVLSQRPARIVLDRPLQQPSQRSRTAPSYTNEVELLSAAFHQGELQ
jgi:NitT/TauT family transport system ATP-binding protein